MCCTVAGTTGLPVSRKYKRRRVSQAQGRKKKERRKRSRKIALKGRRLVIRPTLDATPTARNL